MKLKDFQEGLLRTVNRYLTELDDQAARSAKQAALAEQHPDVGIKVADFTAEAWASLRAAGKLPPARGAVPFSPRRDGTGRPVPNVCLKVPTGGGKTLLAASAISSILDKWQHRRTGFVLWVCPNEAIFSQTRKALRDREHPYRHILDQASGGRTRILEKDDPLNRSDVDSQLCVMLLMLQSANRQTRESLRLFRDRGNVHGFFPPADDKPGHDHWLAEVPNLDHYSDVMLHWHVVKDSLGNALRVIRPIVVLDEGHKGYSSLAMKTLYGFNPSFVLELSATPADRPRDEPPIYSNWLCDIRGVHLDKEHMVKLPINVSVKAGSDWRGCLRDALERLDALQADAERLQAESARYIRPICLVQVERTGRDQRDGQHVHSADAFEYLQTLGLREDQVAIKSAEQDDLKALEQDLTSANNPVRFIITKQALQEGWDCPFAYVLCSLAPVSSRGAMTQLIGRILRQPDTEKTGVESLDECYVLCTHSKTRDVIDAIKNGLEQDGMGDLASQVKEDGSSSSDAGMTVLKRRSGTEQLRIFLPLVRWVEGDHVRELDYETDLLAQADPLAIGLESLAQRLASGDEGAMSHTMKIGLRADHALVEVRERSTDQATSGFGAVHVCRAISDLIPNAWQARDLVGRLLEALEGAGVNVDTLGERTGLVIDELRLHLERELDAMAEDIFRREMKAGRVQFSLRTDGRNYRVPEALEAQLAKPLRPLVREDGNVAEKSLFVPTTEDGLNGLERDVACYVDGKAATYWWFRNVARQQYGLQGWRKHKVYPDLVASIRHEGGVEKLLVLETKGQHLDNEDSAYKRSLLEILTGAYGGVQVVGEMKLELADERELHCELVLEDDWPTRLATLTS